MKTGSTGKTHCTGDESHHQRRIEDLVGGFVLVSDVLDACFVVGSLFWCQESHELVFHFIKAL